MNLLEKMENENDEFINNNIHLFDQSRYRKHAELIKIAQEHCDNEKFRESILKTIAPSFAFDKYKHRIM